MGRALKAEEDKYQARLQARRDRLIDLGNDGLAAATRSPGVRMPWGFSPRSEEMQKCVLMFNTKLVGIPPDVEFKTVTKISSIDDLDKLIAAFEDGSMYFENLSSGRVTRMMQKHGLRGDDDERALRSDSGKVRNLRPPPTRSKHLRKGTKNKTRPFITDEEDARIDREFAEDMAVWVSEGREVEPPVGGVAAAATAADEPEDEIEDAVWSDDDEVWVSRAAAGSDIEDAGGDW